MFPHYPPRSHWRSVLVDANGIPRPNFQPQIGREFGAVGGIRKVSCIAHRGLWRRVFRRVSWYDERDVEPIVPPPMGGALLVAGQAANAVEMLVNALNGGDEEQIQLILNNPDWVAEIAQGHDDE